MKHDLFSAYAVYYMNTPSNPDIRCPDLIECLMRCFGYKRNEPFFGKEGDMIAARYQARGWDWTDGCGEPDREPAWVAQGRRNENMAQILVVFMALFLAGGVLFLWSSFSPPRVSAQAQSQFETVAPQQQYQQQYQLQLQGQPTRDSRTQFYAQR